MKISNKVPNHNISRYIETARTKSWQNHMNHPSHMLYQEMFKQVTEVNRALCKHNTAHLGEDFKRLDVHKNTHKNSFLKPNELLYPIFITDLHVIELVCILPQIYFEI